MAPPRSTLRRDLSTIIGIPFVLMIGGFWWLGAHAPERSTHRSTDLYTALEGRWAWASDTGACVTKWSTISFDSARRVMTIRPNIPWTLEDGTLDSIAEYDLVEHLDDRLVGAIRGETRLTDDGTPVVWEIILTSDSSYAWRRTDWSSYGRTEENIRCPSSGEPMIEALGDSGTR